MCLILPAGKLLEMRLLRRRSAVAFKEGPANLKDHPALKNLNPRVWLSVACLPASVSCPADQRACVQLWINGEFVDGSSGDTFDVIDPRTEARGPCTLLCRAHACC